MYVPSHKATGLPHPTSTPLNINKHTHTLNTNACTETHNHTHTDTVAHVDKFAEGITQKTVIDYSITSQSYLNHRGISKEIQ